MTVPDPALLVRLLTDAGWTNTGGAAGRYARLELLAAGYGYGRTLIVPADRKFGDYDDLMGGTLAELRAAADVCRRAQRVLDGLNAEATT